MKTLTKIGGLAFVLGFTVGCGAEKQSADGLLVDRNASALTPDDPAPAQADPCVTLRGALVDKVSSAWEQKCTEGFMKLAGDACKTPEGADPHLVCLECTAKGITPCSPTIPNTQDVTFDPPVVITMKGVTCTITEWKNAPMPTFSGNESQGIVQPAAGNGKDDTTIVTWARRPAWKQPNFTNVTFNCKEGVPVTLTCTNTPQLETAGTTYGVVTAEKQMCSGVAVDPATALATAG